MKRTPGIGRVGQASTRRQAYDNFPGAAVAMEPFDGLVRPIGVTRGSRAITERGEVDSQDARLFDDVYRERWNRMVRFAALTTQSVALAEEIVQDAFAECYQRWDQVDYPDAYVRQAVASRCTSWVRRRRLERATANVEPLAHTDVHLVETLEALRPLTHRQRAAVYLRYVEDLSEADIAEILGCRIGTVKSLLSRARDHLREVLLP